jgi:hypothetical protein
MDTKMIVSIEELTPFQTKGKKAAFKSGNLFTESLALISAEPLIRTKKV